MQVAFLSSHPWWCPLPFHHADNVLYDAAHGTVFHNKSEIADVPSDLYEVDDLYSTADEFKVWEQEQCLIIYRDNYIVAACYISVLSIFDNSWFILYITDDIHTTCRYHSSPLLLSECLMFAECLRSLYWSCYMPCCADLLSNSSHTPHSQDAPETYYSDTGDVMEYECLIEQVRVCYNTRVNQYSIYCSNSMHPIIEDIEQKLL